MVLREGIRVWEMPQEQKCLPRFPKYCAFLAWQLYDPQKVGFFKESHATLRPQSVTQLGTKHHVEPPIFAWNKTTAAGFLGFC